MSTKQNIWVFFDGRTNPATIHRFAEDGTPSAVVIHVIRDQQVDSDAKGHRVEEVILAGAGNTPALTRLNPGWAGEDWSLGRMPHGLLYVEEEQTRDPHSELAAAERKRIAAFTGIEPPPEWGTNAPGGSPPQAEPVTPTEPEKQQVHPADTNEDGVISRKERRLYRQEHPDETLPSDSPGSTPPFAPIKQKE